MESDVRGESSAFSRTVLRFGEVQKVIPLFSIHFLLVLEIRPLSSPTFLDVLCSDNQCSWVSSYTMGGNARVAFKARGVTRSAAASIFFFFLL